MLRRLILSAFLSLLAIANAAASEPALKTRHVLLIVSDGLRWQEIFTGAEDALLNEGTGGSWASEADLRKLWWRTTPEERRKALFPFIWGTMAQHGQLIGNQLKGSVAHVTNGLAFSYPGYNEMLTGAPDPKIDTNEFGPNPHMSVFEWLNGQPEFHDKIAVFATWAAFSDIFNQKRSRFATLLAGGTPPYTGASLTPRQELMNRLVHDTTRLDEDDIADAFIQVPLLDYLGTADARAVFVGFGETDDWGHAGHYDLLLDAAHAFDRHVEEIWTLLQSRPEYRDSTTIILTADHGRGSGPVDWKEHGVDQKGSENIWLAVMGPDTPPLGERSNIPPVTQAQIAATVAALLGKDYRAAVPTAAPPIAVLLPAR